MIKMEKPSIVFEFEWMNLLRGESPITGGDLIFHGTFGYAGPESCIRLPTESFPPWKADAPLPLGDGPFPLGDGTGFGTVDIVDIV